MADEATRWEDIVAQTMRKVQYEAEADATGAKAFVGARAEDKAKAKGRGKAQAKDADDEAAACDDDPSASLRWWSNPKAAECVRTVPTAFIEPAGPKPYAEDSADKILPKPGFVTDFTNTMRGSEAPTLFLAWGALWTLSTALSRDAWLKWYPKPLYPNLYVIYVAPPGLCKKSVSMDVGTTLLRGLWEHLPDAAAAYAKSFRFVTNKATPDAVNMLLKPDKRVFYPDGGHVRTVNRGSRLTIAVSELATFLGKQQYNTGLVNTITDLYDCKDQDAHMTVGRGAEPVKDVYLTFAGAITPMGLERSIPEEAMGGGLMSRAVTVYQDVPTKIFPIPMALPGYPVIDDLYPKLAWIATHAHGEYTLTPEAFEAYKAWYMAMKKALFEDFAAHREDEFRKDILLLKVALLMRVQEYRPGTDITIENFNDARRLLEYTLARSPEATADVGVSDYTRSLNRVKKRLEGKLMSTRQVLAQGLTRYVDAEQLTRIINDLAIQGFLSIELDGKTIDRSLSCGREVYRVIDPDV